MVRPRDVLGPRRPPWRNLGSTSTSRNRRNRDALLTSSIQSLFLARAVLARIDLFTGLSEFLAVADHASFRAAAAELRVTPAAVSQAIRALETRAGLPLFQRTTRK